MYMNSNNSFVFLFLLSHSLSITPAALEAIVENGRDSGIFGLG